MSERQVRGEGAGRTDPATRHLYVYWARSETDLIAKLAEGWRISKQRTGDHHGFYALQVERAEAATPARHRRGKDAWRRAAAALVAALHVVSGAYGSDVQGVLYPHPGRVRDRDARRAAIYLMARIAMIAPETIAVLLGGDANADANAIRRTVRALEDPPALDPELFARFAERLAALNGGEPEGGGQEGGA